MLNMSFNLDGRYLDDCVTVEPPYELVANFIICEAQGAVAGATFWIDLVKGVIDGTRPPLEYETGNMWTIDADPEWTTLTNEFAWSVPTVRLPTPWLLDALEKWRGYLLDRKRAREQGAPVPGIRRHPPSA